MDGWIVIPNWDRFQHYKNRDPTWIKNYVSLLHDPAYAELTWAQRGILHAIWLEYAASHRAITGSTSGVSRALGGRVTAAQLKALNDAGFIRLSASRPLAPRYHDASPELKSERVKEKEAAASSGASAPAAASHRQQLLAAAERFAHGFNGGGSDLFDEGLDELEQLTGGRLTATERYRLWDEAHMP